MSEEIVTETVYVNTNNEDSHVMSDKVQSLAGSIYKEFERVIKKYDEDVVKDLMPLVVGILEALDAAFAEKQELDVELELFREDNEQLLTQYEREKQLRKGAEQKYLELEDDIDGIKKELEDKVETLESIIRMSEIKSKNTADLVNRLEEKEQETKNEYNKLHERYTELFRTHMEYMERTKILLGTDKLSDLPATSPRITKGTFNLRPVSIAYGNIIELHNHEGFPITYDPGAHQAVSNISLGNELNAHSMNQSNRSADKEQLTESINVADMATTTRLNKTLAEIIASTPELEDSHDLLRSHGTMEQHSSVHNDSSVFEEIQATDIAEVDFSTGISDSDKEDEEEDEESKDNDRDSVGDNFFGMCRELENLIQENTELLATKNALNIVKDDLIAKIDMLTSEQDILREEIVILNSVRRKLQDRISQMEEELKKLKEELEKKDKEQPEKEEEENDVPMAQRKRFTRVEMARVLMERNQYKERLMELQEAVRWTEMMRASKEHPGELQGKKKSGVWNFFGNLFSSSNKTKQSSSVAASKHNFPATDVQPSGDVLKKHRSSIPKSSSCDFLQEDLTSEKAKKERERERREQYKQVRALVKKDDGRMQAYGWSLPAKFTTSVKETSDKFQVPVPVPVHCRPLFNSQTGWKIWCAAGVNLTGGKTKIGHSVGNANVFYTDPQSEDKKESSNGVNLDKELKDSETSVKDTDTELMSSLVWVCTANYDSTQVSVINANNPTDVLETFYITASHILYIASVPGAQESDYPVAEEILKAETPEDPKETVITTGSSPESGGESTGIGGVSFIQCAAGGTGPLTSSMDSLSYTKFDGSLKMERDNSVKEKESSNEITKGEYEEGVDPLRTEFSEDSSQAQTLRDVTLSSSSGHLTSTHIAEIESSGSATDIITGGISSPLAESELQVEISSVLPTMWMGTQSGSIYIHSSVTNWKRCLHAVRLRDSILGIVHVKGRVLVSLANGTVAVFHRAADGQWDLLNYHIIDLGKPRQSIRCMTVVSGKFVWCGYKNKIHIICPQSMTIKKSFDAHPRKESQVRHLCWVGDGVWVSIRLDSTLRLYHAHTHQHLQDVDVEPYVSKMLGTGKLGFSFVRITAMLISCNRLWIGTSNGVIISVPLSEKNKQPMIATSSSLDGPSSSWPGGIVRVFSDTNLDSAASGSFIPYCSMAQAQLSFHGHKDAVKFFVCVPGAQKQGKSPDSDLTSSTPSTRVAVPAPPSKFRLIVSGGEGYIDFRLGDGGDGELAASSSSLAVEDNDDNGDGEMPSKATSTAKLDSSHIIVWQVNTQD